MISIFSSFFFFQAEDGIRDVAVTGVQTCALPISFKDQGQIWLKSLANRKRNPLEQTTIDTRRYALDKWIFPFFGDRLLTDVNNLAMRDFVDHISHLAPSTIRDYSNIVKAVVASAINEKAEELFPRKWNEEFIDAPIIEKQNQPSTTSEGMAEILRYADGQFRVLYALLGGCGPLRAGEALGLEIGKHISEDCRTLYVRQKAKRGKIQPNLKTKHGERDIDLCTPLAAMLRDFIGSRTSGLLFCTSTGKRSEEHTSELQSRLHLVCRLLLEKKKKTNINRVDNH